MKLIFRILMLIAFVSTVGCKVSDQSLQQSTNLQDSIALIEDSLIVNDEIIPELKLYHGELTRHFNLLHTRLHVSFDWEKQHLFGRAYLVLKPYFYDQTNLVLDAKDFDIHHVAILNGNDTLKAEYEYNGQKLNIALEKTYTKDQQLYISIDYSARPNESADTFNIANDKKGLYFINPSGASPGKPQQIWTHGETNTNSKWFPTIDAPNQKSTQEIYITVDEKYTTLSNGKLIFSKSNSDGTRTDYWKMDLPHAPYLFMMAIGEFAMVRDKWNDMPVDYYVEPEFGQYADDIFGNTPEMIDLFSELLNYPYPWQKYSQVVVRDFVSGAMENTTASVFMEDLNVNSRELIDYNWDDIIAHELFHQWFGDLVTCESWANLPLNESFATYGEFLWKNHMYGPDEGEYHLYQELQTYLEEASEKQVDLIRYDYLEEDEMFDSHSYAKGGLILHMLRNYLGDDAFFSSLENYLRVHAFSQVEVHELRLAFERTCGEDLNWFFDQWFLDAGHPKLKVIDEYDEATETMVLKIWQEQDLNLYPVYKLPLTLDLWTNGKMSQYLVEIDRQYQEFEFENIPEPELLLLDSEYILVGEISHSKSQEQWLYQYQQYDSSLRARYEAFLYLTQNEENKQSSSVLQRFLDDDFWVIREETLAEIEEDTSYIFQELEEKIVELANSDPKSLVVAAALSALGAKDKEKYQDIFRNHLYDSSYAVAGNALYAYLQTQASDIPKILDAMKDENNFSLVASIADYYVMNQDFSKYQWFEQKISIYSGSELWYFIKLYGMYIMTAPSEITEQGIVRLTEIARNHNQFYNRLSAYQALELLEDFEGVPEILEKLKKSEHDPRIVDYFK